jgi:hypothetical protein
MKLDPQVFSGGQHWSVAHDLIGPILQGWRGLEPPELLLAELLRGTAAGKHRVSGWCEAMEWTRRILGGDDRLAPMHQAGDLSICT